MTLRDDVWNAALECLVKDGKFRVSDVIDHLNEAHSQASEEPYVTESQSQTIRRVLRQLEDKGWLERSSSQSPIWRVGWKAEMFFSAGQEVTGVFSNSDSEAAPGA